MTRLCEQMNPTRNNPCNYNLFFSDKEDGILQKYLLRELPPIGKPEAS